MKNNPLLTQEQTDAAMVAMLNGQSAEIYVSIDPETGRIQTLRKCDNQMAASVLIAQVIESFARGGLPHSVIRQVVDLGLECSKKKRNG